MVLLGLHACCRSTEAVDPRATGDDDGGDNNSDVLLHEHQNMAKQRWDRPFVSTIRLSDLDSLLSDAVERLSQHRGPHHSLQLVRRHSFPSTASPSYEEDEEEKDGRDMDEEGDCCYGELILPSDNMSLLDDALDPDIPREVGAFPVGSPIALTPRRALFVQRMRARRRPASLRVSRKMSSRLHAMS